MNTLTPPAGELILIRHAPVAEPGRLFGRTDVAARIAPADIAAVQARLGAVARVVSSPALRCRQTAQALFPEAQTVEEDARLWEQDFGTQDGMPFDELPDLGVLKSAELARHAAPGGESFADLCARAAPALTHYGTAACTEGPVALVVHAGVIRAALALVTGHVPGALTFEVSTLSLTRLRCGPEGPIAVIEVNRR